MSKTIAHGDPAADAPESFSNAEIETLFLSAARDGQTDLVTEFLKAGINPDTRNDKGYTALILAAYNGHEPTVRALLEGGASPDLQDAKGATALAGVAFKGDLPCARVLVAHGAGIDVPNFVGRTPLIFAVMFNRDPMVTFLLEHGANPDLRDGEGISARLFATRQGNGDDRVPGVVMWTVDTMRPGSDGFRVVISAFNNGAMHGEPTRETPALTMEQLREIALSEEWEELR